MEIEMKCSFVGGLKKFERLCWIIRSRRCIESSGTFELFRKSDTFFTSENPEDTLNRVGKGGRVVRIRTIDTLLTKYTSEVLMVRRGSKCSDLYKMKDVNGEYISKTEFTVKDKKLVNGYECNDEQEIPIDYPETLTKMLEIMGYKPWFNKTKFSMFIPITFKDYSFNIEIERVTNELSGKDVWYVEIENVENGCDQNSEQIVSMEKELFEMLELDLSNIDNRPWVHILNDIETV